MRHFRLKRKIGGTIGVRPNDVIAIEGSANAGEVIVTWEGRLDEDDQPTRLVCLGDADELLDELESVQGA